MTAEEALANAIERATTADRLLPPAFVSGRVSGPSVDWAVAVAASAQAWAMVSLAASNLVPEPEEVAAAVEAQMEGQARLAVERIQEVEGILDHAAREMKRHPAIHAALEVIRRP